MSSLRRNIVANFAGRAWTVALGLVFPPIYARLLGIESYGLVGLWTSLNMVLGVLDLGLSTTLNRELARYSAEDDRNAHREMRDVFRTIELVFWLTGIVAGAVVVLLAPVISRHWVNAERLSNAVITNSIQLMGLVFALQWPMGIYSGGLLGLQKQVTANVIQAVFSAVRVLGSAFLLWKVSPSIQTFFLWQLATTAGQTIATKVALNKSLPGETMRGAFSWKLLLRNWRFSLGMSVISILAIGLSQGDKMIVSKLLTLQQFGYYTLAWTVGGSLANLIHPVFIAVFPRLSQLVKQGELGELSRAYHASCQLVSVAVLPAAAIMVGFSHEILLAWSGDPHLVAMTSGVVVLMAMGTAMHGLMHMPYALQLAFGWTRLNAVANLLAVFVIIPLEYWLTKRNGMIGAAFGWVVLNATYVAVVVPVMHCLLLRGEQWRWYLVDVALPLLGLAAVVLPIRLFVSAPRARLAVCAYLIAIGIAAAIAAAACAPAIRARGLGVLARWSAARATTRK